MTLLPIYAFMLIPVWIPMIAMAIGGLTDAVQASRAAASHAARSTSVSAGRPAPAAGTAR